MSANSVLSPSVYLNGKIVSAEHAHVSALDQGFLYGVGFFETFRTSGGRPHHWSYNRERLGSSCTKAGLVLPETFLGRDESKLTHTVTDLLRLGEASEGVFRYTVSAGDGKALTELLTYRSLPSTTPIHGICMRVLRLRRDNGEWIPRPKSLNYLNATARRSRIAEQKPGSFRRRHLSFARRWNYRRDSATKYRVDSWADRIHVPDASLGGVAGTCLAWMQAQGHAIVPARIDLAGFLKAEAIFVV